MGDRLSASREERIRSDPTCRATQINSARGVASIEKSCRTPPWRVARPSPIVSDSEIPGPDPVFRPTLRTFRPLISCGGRLVTAFSERDKQGEPRRDAKHHGDEPASLSSQAGRHSANRRQNQKHAEDHSRRSTPARRHPAFQRPSFMTSLAPHSAAPFMLIASRELATINQSIGFRVAPSKPARLAPEGLHP